MISSMTGYASVERRTASGTLIWDLRSVNHRYLENYFKLPDSLKGTEAVLREILRSGLDRGKVEATLQFRPAGTAAGVKLSPAALHAAAMARLLRQELGEDSALIDPAAILALPGILDGDTDDDSLRKEAEDSFREALAQLKEARKREGAKLEAVLLSKLEAVEAEVARIRALMPEILAWQREKLTKALETVKSSTDPSRVEQELILVAQRLDVAEEMDRLTAHVSEVRDILRRGGSCGRKLDFMMQEFNRETNTIASKSISTGVTASAVELKVIIEQMREQIQNIE